jgi:uncharacterized surface protein with fasciclin (FAS1) repeats
MIYPKNAGRPIMLTDDSCDKTIDELKATLESLFESKTIFTIATTDDLLIGKPSELGFIHVNTDGECESFTVKAQEETVVNNEINDETYNELVNSLKESESVVETVDEPEDYDFVITDD